MEKYKCVNENNRNTYNSNNRPAAKERKQLFVVQKTKKKTQKN